MYTPETLPCGGRWRPPGCSLSRTDKCHLTSLSNPALISGDFSICRKKNHCKYFGLSIPLSLNFQMINLYHVKHPLLKSHL